MPSHIPKEALQIDEQLKRLTEGEREEYQRYISLVGFVPSDPNYPAFTLTFISYCLTRRLQQQLSTEAEALTKAAQCIQRDATKSNAILREFSSQLSTETPQSTVAGTKANKSGFFKGCFLGGGCAFVLLLTAIVVLLIASLPFPSSIPVPSNRGMPDETSAL